MTLGVGILGTGQASAAGGTVDRAAFGVAANGLVNIPRTPDCSLALTAGDCNKSALSVNVPGTLTTGILNAATQGTLSPLKATSKASAATVSALAGAVTADLISSQCSATLNAAGTPVLTGSTHLLNAQVGGTAVSASPAPNTKIAVDLGPLGSASVILNEQTRTSNRIIVKAVDIQVTNLLGVVTQNIVIAQSRCSVHPAAAPAPAGTGYLEICKKANNSNGAVTGRYTFRFDGRSATVPVGKCTGPMKVTAGNLTVREVAKSGTRISACSTRPATRLLRCDPANRRAVVRIVKGGVSNETTLFITNRKTSGTSTGAIKVCKIAGSGVAIGKNFTFRVGTRTLTVPAGPASQGGYCKIAYRFTRGSHVKVTEAARSGVHVSRITVRPDREISASKANRTATVRVGSGFTVVTFTNTANGR